MAWKDYYVVLGVSPGASQDGIRSAFRDLAMRHHPDRAGADSTGRFQEITEAYNVLGDPARRAEYDDERRRRERRRHADERGAGAESFAGPGGGFGRSRRPGRGSTRPHAEPFSDPRARPSGGSGAEPFTAGPFRAGGDGRGAWSGRPARGPVRVEITLSASEARRGGEIDLAVPVGAPCPRCAGTGRVGPYRCPRCAGRGARSGRQPLRLGIPPGVRDGTRLSASLADAGELEILIRVRA